MKKLRIIIIGIMMAVCMTACNDDTTTVTVTELEDDNNQANAEQIVSESRLEVLVQKYYNDNISHEEFMELADLLVEDNRVKEARDYLERDYLQYGQDEDIDKLNSLWVNAKEEQIAFNLINELKECVSNKDYSNIYCLIETNDSLPNMKPRVREELRNYYLIDGDDRISISIGLDESNNVYALIYLENSSSNYVKVEKDNFVVIIKDGTFDEMSGAFELVSVSSNGKIIKQSGELKKGYYLNDLTISVAQKDGSIDGCLSDLDSVQFTVYEGSFDGEGNNVIEQPKEKVLNNLLKGTGKAKASVYAYNKDKTNCLYVLLGEDETVSYGVDLFGFVGPVKYNEYEPVTQEENQLVKVLDGMILIKDGDKWTQAGILEEVESKDKYKIIVDSMIDSQETVMGDTEKEKSDIFEIVSGSSVEPKQNNNSNQGKQNNNSKEQTTQGSTEQQPASNGGGGGGSSTPDQTPTPSQGSDPAPTQNQDPAPTQNQDPAPAQDNGGSNDVDVEWTPDML